MYSMLTPWLYIYYARHTKDARVVRQGSFDQIRFQQFMKLAVPVILCVHLCGAYIGNFWADRLKRSMNDTLEMSRTISWVVNPIVAWEMGKEDLLGLRRTVAGMRNDARNLLVLQTMLDVDWSGSFNAKNVLNTGA